MKISNNFILEQIIMPDIKPAYKIIFIDEQNMDNLNYFNGLSYQERLLLKPYFMEIGGHWSEAHNSFVFIKEISTKIIREAIKKANKLLPLTKEQIEREKLQAYFTPPDIARKMQEFADISDNDIVLDPSAGTGNLVNDLTIPKERIFLVEPNAEFCELLRKNGYMHVIQATFEEALSMTVLPNNIPKILMNPPFSKQTDLKHISLAYDLLAQGGTLVGILGRNSILQRGANNEKSSILESFIDKFNSSKYHQIIKLEPGSFEVSGTICDTCMVVLEKERLKEMNIFPNNIGDHER